MDSIRSSISSQPGRCLPNLHLRLAWASLHSMERDPDAVLTSLTLFLSAVSLESKSSVAKFPVTIRHPVLPKLYDPGPGMALAPGAAWWHPVALLVGSRSPLRPRLRLHQSSSSDMAPDS